MLEGKNMIDEVIIKDQNLNKIKQLIEDNNILVTTYKIENKINT